MKNSIITTLFVIIQGLFFVSCNQKPKQQVAAILYNGVVYTSNSAFETAEAIAIEGDKIIAFGSTKEIRKKYTSVQEIDLEQAVVYPGFIDAHSHLLGYGKFLNQADLKHTTSFEDLLQKVQDFAMTSNAEWVVGRGWNETTWESKTTPNKMKLDMMFPNTPVCLSRVDGHAVLVNQVVLDLIGIHNKTVIPGGKIEKMGDMLTGVLVDAAADKAKAMIPKLKEDEMKKAILLAQEKCIAAGLTAVTDAGLDLAELKAYMALDKENKLKLRVYAMMNPTAENFAFFDSIGKVQTAHLVIRSVKIYADGALGSKGALLKKPYCDDSTVLGLLQKPWSWIEETCHTLYNKGWQVNTHCIGDSANAKMLQIYANILKTKNDLRWRIEHAQVVDPIDWHYFGDYSILPSVQPTHATSDMYMAMERLCSHRMTGAYAYQSLLKQNGRLPLGTDFPIEDISPIGTYFSAVTRKNTKGEPAGGFYPMEALTFEQAIKGMTIWAAHANFIDDFTGSLEKGKKADLVILNKDLKFLNDDTGLTVQQVWIDGKRVK